MNEFHIFVLILRNTSLKLKMVVDNAILQNYAVSSENISWRIKIKTENGFHLKRNVCKFRWNKSRSEKQSHRRHFAINWKNIDFFESIAAVDTKSPLSSDILFQISMNAAINRSL